MRVECAGVKRAIRVPRWYNDARQRGISMRSMTSVLVAGAALLSAAWAGAPTREPETSLWLTDFAAAQEQARRERRPILAVLH
jgi:hypothetical protein